jgi:hypothetical protein
MASILPSVSRSIVRATQGAERGPAAETARPSAPARASGAVPTTIPDSASAAVVRLRDPT